MYRASKICALILSGTLMVWVIYSQAQEPSEPITTTVTTPASTTTTITATTTDPNAPARQTDQQYQDEYFQNLLRISRGQSTATSCQWVCKEGTMPTSGTNENQAQPTQSDDGFTYNY